MRIFLTSLIVGLGFALPINAQSYEKTVKFVLEKTQVSFYGGEKLTVVSFPQKCVLKSKRTYIDKNGNVEAEDFWMLDLSEADPSKVESNIENSTIRVSTLKNEELVKYRNELFFPYSGQKSIHGETLQQYKKAKQANPYKCTGTTCVIESADKTLIFHTFDAGENGPRLERAMKHLVGLCGGKEELF